MKKLEGSKNLYLDPHNDFYEGWADSLCVAFANAEGKYRSIHVYVMKKGLKDKAEIVGIDNDLPLIKKILVEREDDILKLSRRGFRCCTIRLRKRYRTPR